MPLGGVASEAGSDSDGGASDAVVLTLGRRPPTETLGLVPRGGRDSTTFARGAGAGTPGVGLSAFALEAGAGAAGGGLHVPPDTDSDDEGAEPAHSQLGRGVARLPRETQCPAPGGGVGSTMPARGAVADAARLLGVTASALEAGAGADAPGVRLGPESDDSNSEDEQPGFVLGGWPGAPSSCRPGAPVNDMPSCFRWASRLWAALKDVFGEERVLSRLFHGPAPIQLSSHFSGLGTLEAALGQLAAAGRRAMRAQLGVRASYACEKSPLCRRAVGLRTGSCLFADILDRLDGLEPSALCPGGQLDYARAAEAVKSAAILAGGPCVTHDAWCTAGQVTGDVSGSPCTPWSRAAGHKRLGRRHPCVLLLLAWCSIMRSTKPPFALHENVCGFDSSVLSEMLGDLYQIQALVVSPDQAGFLMIRRPRRYYFLVLLPLAGRKGAAEAYARVCDLMAHSRGQVSEPVRWAFRASAQELLAEENAARQRRELDSLAEHAGPSTDWTYLLTEHQRRTLEAHRKHYTAQHGTDPALDECCTVDLSQSAERQGSASRETLATFRRNSGRIWSTARRRWLTPRERAACMGYAVYDDLAAAAGVKLDTAVEQGPLYAIGNAMHVANLGCVLMTCLVAAEVPLRRS
jgi:site-specific DNA-cytosine methylase